MNAKGRLTRLERQAHGGDFDDVIGWIKAGRNYDELTREEQRRYCAYHGDMDKEPCEIVLGRAFVEIGEGDENYAHFQLYYKPKPLTPAEIKQRYDELDAYMTKAIAEYNNPEAIAERQREYEELQEIGRKRQEAFYAGLPMDTYPLPSFD